MTWKGEPSQLPPQVKLEHQRRLEDAASVLELEPALEQWFHADVLLSEKLARVLAC